MILVVVVNYLVIDFKFSIVNRNHVLLKKLLFVVRRFQFGSGVCVCVRATCVLAPVCVCVCVCSSTSLPPF